MFTSGPPTCLWSFVSVTLEFSKLNSLWRCGSQIHLHAVVWRVCLKCKSKQTCPCLRASSGSLLTGWSPGCCSRPDSIMVERYSFPRSPSDHFLSHTSFCSAPRSLPALPSTPGMFLKASTHISSCLFQLPPTLSPQGRNTAHVSLNTPDDFPCCTWCISFIIILSYFPLY